GSASAPSPEPKAAVGETQAALQAGSNAAPAGNAAPKTNAAQAANTAAPAERAVVGKPAPAFSLPSVDGKDVHLSDYAGKVVVLEWFNPECPFVRASHTKGSLKDAASRLAKQGIVYLAINSAAPGKQGHGAETNRAGAEKFNMSHPVLL